MFLRTMLRTGLASSIGTPCCLANGFSWIDIIVPANNVSAALEAGGMGHRRSAHTIIALYQPGPKPFSVREIFAIRL